jgi:hypothetical protein
VALKSEWLTVDAFMNLQLLSFSFVSVANADFVFIDNLPDRPIALVKVRPTADASVIIIIDNLFVLLVKVEQC